MSREEALELAEGQLAETVVELCSKIKEVSDLGKPVEALQYSEAAMNVASGLGYLTGQLEDD